MYTRHRSTDFVHIVVYKLVEGVAQNMKLSSQFENQKKVVFVEC